GLSAPDGYTWRRGESALDYLQRLTKACLGYKIVESTDGSVYRAQILTGSPGADHTFTEGVDIFEGAHTVVESFDQYSAWEVTGFDYGDGLGAVYNRRPDPAPDGVAPYQYSSEMIERNNEADTRAGISCERVVDYLQGESGAPLVKLSGFVTPRDELIGPGGSVHVNSAMLGVNQNFWVISVTRETTEEWFLQTLELAG
ncbi:MAG TPA: hypothetical protein VFB50_16010, partial [Chloroflexota bacterium]|nr:hypothetical protein [Chloroflexota bacterium]